MASKKIKLGRYKDTDDLDEWCEDLLLILNSEVGKLPEVTSRTLQASKVAKTVKEILDRYIPKIYLKMLQDDDILTANAAITAFKTILRGNDYVEERNHEARNMRQSDCEDVTKYIAKKNMLLQDAGEEDEDARVNIILAGMDTNIRKEISYSRQNTDKELTVKELLALSRMIEGRFRANEQVNITKTKDHDRPKKRRSVSVDDKDSKDSAPISMRDQWILERFEKQNSRLDVTDKAVLELSTKTSELSALAKEFTSKQDSMATQLSSLTASQDKLVELLSNGNQNNDRHFGRSKSNTYGNRSYKNNQGWQQKDRDNNACYYCHTPGHIASKCPEEILVSESAKDLAAIIIQIKPASYSLGLVKANLKLTWSL
jgi:hypothetical protein